MANLVRTLIAVLALTVLRAPAAWALDTGDIVIVSLKGEVRVTMGGAERAVRAGAVLLPPAAVRTGHDGAIELRQGATTVSVGPDTVLEFPALEKAGGPIDRIVQPKGNAFYDIGKREGRRLRVETPYLVGVIKGTQFNVAAQDGATTISLFEGRLEVQATGTNAVVDLLAGEIASRRRGEQAIGVLKMEPGRSPPAQRPSPGSAANDAGRDESRAPAQPGAGDDDSGLMALRPDTSLADNSDARGGAVPGHGVVTAPQVDAAPSPDISLGVDTAPAVDAVPTVDAGASAAVDVDVDVDVRGGISTGAEVGADLAGAVTVDTSGGAAVELATPGVDAEVDLGAAVGIGDTAGVETHLDVDVDPGAGTPDVVTTVDVGASVGGVDVGANVGADVGAGAVDLGLDVGGVNLDLGVDLGLDDGNNGHGDEPGHVDNSNPGTPQNDPGNNLGGLIDGLLGRDKKRK